MTYVVKCFTMEQLKMEVVSWLMECSHRQENAARYAVTIKAQVDRRARANELKEQASFFDHLIIERNSTYDQSLFDAGY